jgi:hypothetical protein
MELLMNTNVPVHLDLMTADELRDALPKHLIQGVSQQVLDNINDIIHDPDMMDHFKDNMLNYVKILSTGKYKITDYINAVHYVSFKLIGFNNTEAYAKVFPDRYQRLLDMDKTPKQISSYVANYNSNELVNKIWEQTLIPTHVLNAHHFQQAINVQVDLMLNSSSDKVKCDAANSLLTHLKRPETVKMEIDIGNNSGGVISELNKTIQELVAAQRTSIMSGSQTAHDIAQEKIINGSYEEME